MKKFEVVGCLFFWRITDNGFLEAATGLGEVCVWWKIYNKLVCFMAIDWKNVFFFYMALCFDCVMAVVEQVVNAFTTRNCSWFTLFFVVIFFFRNFDALWLFEAPLYFLFFGFLFRKTRTPIGGPEVIFKNRLRDSNPGANPCSGGFILALVLACVIVGVVLSMSHCWLMSLKTRYPDSWPTHSVDSAAGQVWRYPHSGLSESTQSWP